MRTGDAYTAIINNTEINGSKKSPENKFKEKIIVSAGSFSKCESIDNPLNIQSLSPTHYSLIGQLPHPIRLVVSGNEHESH